EELQRGEGALCRCGARDVAALHADGVSGERETDGGDARERPGGGAVGGEAVRRVGQVPEVVERPLLERVQKAHRLRRVWGRRAGGVVRGTGGEEGRGERGGAIGHAGTISRPCRAGHRCWRTGGPRWRKVRSYNPRPAAAAWSRLRCRTECRHSSSRGSGS